MKKISMIFLMMLSIGLTWTLTGCDKEDDIDPTDQLTAQEIEDLQFMREEEKLARDVYLYMDEKYDFMVFANISGSEQKHMDFVLDIMEKYGVDDNADPERGVFNNPNLQTLYNTLIAQGEQSFYQALVVGATIEDVDIKDLGDAMATTENEDLLDLYSTLQCGSRNHIRAFTSHVENNGDAYVPQFISQELYDEILDGSHESCGG
mgnify:CR=1 FL=1